MPYMLQIRESTIRRILPVWVIFMETIFIFKNPKSNDRFLGYSLPELFNKTGHGLTDEFNSLN